MIGYAVKVMRIAALASYSLRASLWGMVISHGAIR